MFIYISLFIIIILFCIKYDFSISKDENNRYKSFYFLCVILSLVAGLRYHIGSDTANYIADFDEIPTLGNILVGLDFKDLSQPLWYLFNAFCKTITDDFILVQLLHSFIVNICIGRFIYKLCKKPFLGLLAYVCCCWWNFNFEILRESMCIAIYLNLIYNYIKHNNIFKFLLYSIPLIFIHHFAFIPIALTVIIYFLNYKPFLYLGCVATIILYFILSEGMLLQYMLTIESVMGGDSVERAIEYIQSDQYGFMTSSIIGILFVIITKVAYAFVVAGSKKINPLIAKLLLLYGFTLILRLKIMILVRFINYWQIILIVYAINYIIENRKQVLSLYVKFIFVYNIYSGVDSFLTPLDSDTSKYDCRYIPYSSYISKKVHPARESLFY